jgi:hypothetical protein
MAGGVLEECQRSCWEYGLIIIQMVIVCVLYLNVKSLSYVEVRTFVMLF